MMHKSLRHLRSRYGITAKQYLELYESQEGLCAGCGKEPLGGGKGNANCNLFVDHNHMTDEVRGLLCQGCNAAVGLAKDSPNILRNLANYLEKEAVLRPEDFPAMDRGFRERSKQFCPQGHPYNEINTRYKKNGWRTCISCTREYDRKRWLKRKQYRHTTAKVTELT